MNSCPNQKRNLQDCNCSYGACSRKGLCCECLRYHRQNREIPACFFPDKSEKTYDRSITAFIRTNQ
jgi:hypothetical protein